MTSYNLNAIKDVDVSLYEIVKAFTKTSCDTIIEDELIQADYRINPAQLDRMRSDNYLYVFDSILVSEGINKNRDYFSKDELWTARFSPEHKFINYNHNPEIIIGHTIGSKVVDDENNEVEDLENIQSTIHLMTKNILYKFYGKDTQLEKLRAISLGIIDDLESSDHSWFVSMECLMRTFDFMLVKDDERIVVPNIEETSFLKAFMPQYNSAANGKYNNYDVYRLLKGITFVGQGIVKKPANPNSKIFDDGATANNKQNKQKPSLVLEIEDIENIDNVVATNVNNVNDIDNTNLNNEDDNNDNTVIGVSTNNMDNPTEKTMTQEDTDKVNAEVAKLREECAKAISERDEFATKYAKASSDVDSLAQKVSDYTALQAKVQEAEALYAELKSKYEEKEAAYASLKNEHGELSASLEKINAEIKLKTRSESLVKAGLSEELAIEKANDFSTLSDEVFEKVLETFRLATSAKSTANNSDGNTKVVVAESTESAVASDNTSAAANTSVDAEADKVVASLDSTPANVIPSVNDTTNGVSQNRQNISDYLMAHMASNKNKTSKKGNE